MKQIKTLLRILVLVFVSLVVGINLYTWNAKSLMGNALPMPMGYGAAIVLTGSMEPTIMEDDLILVAKKPVYAVGDIVVYQSGNILVVHRIVDIADGLITTRGDANQADDAPVEASAIKGKVISIIPWMGSLARILKTPAATIILLVAAVLMLESSFRKEKKKGDDQLEKIKEEIRKLKDGQQ
ncbi:MAG: signal peptidase I [Ruminococcaceae bacterium]|nr:signal peptidase I [Oscillospiraceae bacterium]